MHRSLLAILALSAALPGAELVAARAPGDGIQPQALVDAAGAVHLLTYRGAADGGDLDYRVRPAGATAFGEPIVVTKEAAGSAVAMGSMRGGHLALGRDGWVHVTWVGSAKAPRGLKDSTPGMYARKSATAAAFEAPRNLVTWATGIDGGITVAADDKGDVYAVWHAGPGAMDDTKRSVYLARSKDDGANFGREVQAVQERSGACACCGIRAAVDADGSLAVLFRTASTVTERDMTLAFAANAAKPASVFRTALLEPWKTPTCPMSTSSIAHGRSGLLLAWQGEHDISWARLAGGKVGATVVAAKVDGAKHPSIAESADGSVAVVWLEGVTWGKGGSLHWRIYGADGKPQGEPGTQAGVPPWSIPSVVSTASGRFEAWY